jgi:hypothetical protein
MVWIVEQPFETWRAVVTRLRHSELPYDHEAAQWIEQNLDQTPADQYDVTLHIPDEIYLRSVYGAELALGIKLLPDER